MSLGRSAIGGEAVAGSGDGAQLVRKPPGKRTLTAFADPTVAPEPR